MSEAVLVRSGAGECTVGPRGRPPPLPVLGQPVLWLDTVLGSGVGVCAVPAVLVDFRAL